MTDFTITSDNLYKILPFKVSQLAMLYAKQSGASAVDAILTIYKSNTYKMLSNEQTKMWHWGPVALFEYFNEHH